MVIREEEDIAVLQQRTRTEYGKRHQAGLLAADGEDHENAAQDGGKDHTGRPQGIGIHGE